VKTRTRSVRSDFGAQPGRVRVFTKEVPVSISGISAFRVLPYRILSLFLAGLACAPKPGDKDSRELREAGRSIAEPAIQQLYRTYVTPLGAGHQARLPRTRRRDKPDPAGGATSGLRRPHVDSELRPKPALTVWDSLFARSRQ